MENIRNSIATPPTAESSHLKIAEQIIIERWLIDSLIAWSIESPNGDTNGLWSLMRRATGLVPL